MRTRKYDGSDLRKILSSMITNRTVCGRISSQWVVEGLFDSKWANLIGGWCVEHLRKFDTPPGSHIRIIFEEWASGTATDDETVEAVERFLVNLSDEAEEYEVDYILDLAANHFNKIRIKRELELALIELERNDLERAQDRVARLHKVELGVGSYIEPGKDFEVWRQAFEKDKRRPLVTYPGDAGEFIGDAFVRGEFYAFCGPDKTGKTTFLLDFAYRAARQRNRVVFFDTGDSDQDAIMVRLASRTTRCPEYEQECSFPIEWNEDDLVVKKESVKAVHPGEGFERFKKIIKTPDALRISCHPNTTLNVQGIEGILSDWDRDGWTADVVVVDYADILAAPSGVNDTLDQIDVTWKQLRRLSQSRHCLVVTATQSSAAAYGREKGLLGRQHFSGRKTKNAHVDGMIGINVSDDEREQHMARLNWIVRRRQRNRDRRKYVRVAGCFDVENPIIQSKW